MTASAGAGDMKTLLDRAEDYAGRGDARSAMTFYQAALKQAQGKPDIDPELLPRLQRGQQFIGKAIDAFREALERAVDENRPHDPVGAMRVSHALSMLKGERQVYLQEPSVLYYPYLAQRQYFEREEFDWVPALEAATADIRDELRAVLQEGADFRPYVENDPDRPAGDFAGLNENPAWTALYLWRNGTIVEENARRFPRTMAALEKVPLSQIGDRTPAVLFSRLEPGAHIPPHNGMLNCRLICHLPLIVPKGCWLRVGNEKREWEEGKLLMFDDSFEHEAMNPTSELRIILLFDVWRPELGPGERSAISAIFDAIDQFQGLPDA
jgi:aspartyl/asparaginyl beta-hydroxylase (cupin superfamily)